MATLPLKIKPFAVPEDVVLDMPPGRKQDGPIGLPRIRLQDLPDEVLDQLITEFAEAVMKAARPE